MRRRDLLVAPVAAAAIGAAAAALIRFNPLGLFHSCPLRIVTGIPCPACGGTAAVKALLRGDMRDAVIASPLVALVAVGLGVAAVAALLAIPWAHTIQRLPRPRSRLLLWSAIGLIAANWIYLLIQLS